MDKCDVMINDQKFIYTYQQQSNKKSHTVTVICNIDGNAHSPSD